MLSRVCRQAPMLLPSGWLRGAEGGMVVAVKSLADWEVQGKGGGSREGEREGWEGSYREEGVITEGCMALSTQKGRWRE